MAVHVCEGLQLSSSGIIPVICIVFLLIPCLIIILIILNLIQVLPIFVLT
jgi:hypothetical protein